MEYGRYRILNQLGQGGMATVYLAEDPLLNRLVAIKVIQAHLSSNSSLMDRFTVEAKTIASLRHINIVEVFDFGAQDDQQYLVMEYIDGQNLQAVCVAQGGRPMPNTVAAAIVCQAAEGLTSAEKHGVVHRDIKPENLMFNSEGTLKIADFGIAHIADEQSRTQTGAVLGSPNFMSPEQIEGLRPTNQTDIFSLGGVFYYCQSGKMPFTGPSIPVTMRNICERQPPPILEINPGADPYLISLTETLLQKSPDQRGDGARWLANQLRTYLNSHGIVDIVDHVKSYIASLGVSGGGQTIMESPTSTKSGMRPFKTSSGSSLSGLPNSSIIKSGSSLGGNLSQSHSLANPSSFHTQATTGAMGPSSRSPLVWIGGVLSLCVLILAGAVIWSRMDHEDTPSASNMTTSAPKPAERATLKADPVVANSLSPESLASNAMSTQSSSATQVVSNTSSQLLASQARAQEERQNLNAMRARAKDFVRDNYSSQQAKTPSSVKNQEKPLNSSALQGLPPSEPMASSTATGFVLVKSAPPFAALTINGKPQGETPMNAYLEVPVGKCHVEIVHRLSPPFDTTIMITPGFRREFKFKLDR